VNGIAKKIRALDLAFAEEVPGRPPTFLDIAAGTGGHEITQRMVAALHARLYVVDGQVLARKDLATVYTAITVPPEDRRAAASVTILV
jgi:hypothetical protein